MKSTLIHYQDGYFNYKGVVGEDRNDNNKDENGLAIGAYEAAFCADELDVMMAWQSSTNTCQYDKQYIGSVDSNSRSMNWWAVTSSNSWRKYGILPQPMNHPPH
eukprot:2203807-Ditylum_brightwellii.AAC.1